MGWDALERALRDAGRAAECLMRATSGAHAPEDPVFRAALGGRATPISGLGVHQLLFEVIRPEAYAGLLAELLEGVRALPGGVFAVADEGRVWI